MRGSRDQVILLIYLVLKVFDDTVDIDGGVIRLIGGSRSLSCNPPGPPCDLQASLFKHPSRPSITSIILQQAWSA